MTDATQSFLPVDPSSPFPIQNLPYGVFRRPGASARCGVALGEWVVDLAALEESGLISAEGGPWFGQGSLNHFAAAGRPIWRRVRADLQRLLSADEPRLRDDTGLRERAVIPQADVEMLLPFEIGDYTDFYSSKEHATNVGTMFRGPDNALQPNWLHLPVAYHGRASSVVPSGTPVRRPRGQLRPDETRPPEFGPSRALDFELEMGFFTGPGNRLGEPIDVAAAEDHIFGLVLVNDWSARDIQRWEYVPLGPFLSKNFCTSISPWVVTLEALEPFRCGGPRQEPTPLPYLQSTGDRTFDIQLEVALQTPAMDEPSVITRSNFRYLYWNMSQQLAHHTVTGCNVKPGDLMASGTISGPTPDSRGSMLELAWRGEQPLTLPDGERRSMLQDGDTLVMSAWAQGEGFRVGFGDVRGTIVPAGAS